ncbi:flagellar biosynthesis repressor FlbT [Kaistia algarum]|uniref:flagellar biosynthesis repressor FlbT n=1 Tax=Kaistia algarum TaxID=2083279 RepID=UPI000CE91B88|nr:flagellar biosynthesis repressor FlbT [Kaistia algarum]MCX5516030.1 flagellar biosynthesis repressor FlbT [Kaistia algarum]PPE77960.1 flagellar biosynthesis repressor FlbT [Kaistia algarum]
MALKLELKAGERLHLGDCVVVNEGGRARLLIEGDWPVLRGKDVLEPERADSEAKRLYLAVQSMYLTRRPGRFIADYARLSREIVSRVPERRAQVEVVDGLVASGRFYLAMRAAQRLIDEEGRVAL